MEDAFPVAKDVIKINKNTNIKEEGEDMDYILYSEDSDEAKVSFITTSTDDFSILLENYQMQIINHLNKKYYYLSTQEITICCHSKIQNG